MRTSIDRSGRLVLPKKTRDRLGIKAGDELEIEPVADGVCLKVVPRSAQLVWEGGVLVVAGGKLDRRITDVVQESRDERLAELVRQAIS